VNGDFPAPRRFTVEIGATDSDTIRFGDTHPQLCGWVLSWATHQAINGSLPQAIFTCQDRWFQQAEIPFGDQNLAPSIAQGGRVFVPYPTVVLDFFDAGGIGGVTTEIIGRPVLVGQDPGALTTLIAWQEVNIAAAATSTVTFPDGAFNYLVTKAGQASDVTVFLQSGPAFGINWDTYTLTDAGFPSGQHTPTPWRPLPPPDASSTGQVEITNNDGVNSADLAVLFQFDFAAGR
jgi:hypothetical protein